MKFSEVEYVYKRRRFKDKYFATNEMPDSIPGRRIFDAATFENTQCIKFMSNATTRSCPFALGWHKVETM
ncbi:uncharacterized protein PHALS_12719 [Plasmopara halstedii]|uniref:Uncharacterized protein n=1 Tax=Plasmopara halstedii TaxID=4781 RepID=A0A0N7L5U4_PLAHL|nr:uncharacterized protein PHALS_12719 [Plasmopara halstedii]CEG42443.1 hypothetical protein PHALS_12719 [Plasmopara halstedii]|eukprot:XP_024578812.1 hypothetical protein PHALS_12719 [Plasmopara halstedii]